MLEMEVHLKFARYAAPIVALNTTAFERIVRPVCSMHVRMRILAHSFTRQGTFGISCRIGRSQADFRFQILNSRQSDEKKVWIRA